MKRLIILASALALAACSGSKNNSDGGSASSSGAGSTGGSSAGSTGGSSTGGSGTSGSSGTSGNPDAGPFGLSDLQGDVTVTYDAQDVPHIHCQGLLDCIRVQGYIHAQDRLWEMDIERHLAEGRISELVGDPGLAEDEFFRTLFITPDGTPVADALVANLDPDTQAFVQAYVDGVNDYLHQAQSGQVAFHANEYDNLLVSANQIADWTPADTLAMGRLVQWELSGTLDQEVNFGQMYAAIQADSTGAMAQRLAPLLDAKQIDPAYTLPGSALAAPAAHTVHRATHRALHLPADLGAALAQLHARLATTGFPLGKDGFKGSNDWVVDAAHSANGKAMVANDPHLTLQYPPLFYLSHLTADADGIDVLGASFPGIPGALTGRGKHVGWGVTVVGYDVTDLYVETFAPDATHVMFNGAPVAVKTVNETIKVRDASTGALVPQTFAVSIVPHHGPIFQKIDATHALSVRWTGQQVTSEVRALRKLLSATSVDDAFTALEDWGTGAQNFVLADDQGHIGYDPHALVPARPWASQTLPPWAPLPGDGTAEWGYGDGGLWIPDDQLPQSKNPAQGFLMTANSDPVGVTDDGDPTNDPNYLSFGFDDQTGLRAGRITELLQGFTADGGKVTVDDMKAIQSDHKVILGRYVVPIADRAYQALAVLPDGGIDPVGSGADGGVGAAVALLDQWASDGYDCPTGLTDIQTNSAPDPDPVVTRDSAACTYFHAFAQAAMQDIFADDSAQLGFDIDSQLAFKALISMTQPGATDTVLCDEQLPIADGGFQTQSATCDDEVMKALGQARDALVAKFGANTDDWRWGAVHTATFENPISTAIFPTYNAGPFARPGGAFSVDVAMPDALGGSSGASPLDPTKPEFLNFDYTHGPNERFVASMDDDSAPSMQLPGYQVDGPYAGPPTGTLLGWLKNQYFDFAHTPDQVTAAGVRTVVFTPAP